MSTWVGGAITDLGNEVTGGEVLDLAFNPLQARDSHGRWVKTGMADSVFSPPPDDFPERQRATRVQLVAASQRRIMRALTMDPSQMSDEQIHTAAQVLESLTPHDYEQIRRATREVVPAHIADHVDQRVSGLAKDLQTEQNRDARRKLIAKLALVIGALALSFTTAALGVPVGIAALIGLIPEFAKEYSDFKIERKKEPLIARAS